MGSAITRILMLSYIIAVKNVPCLLFPLLIFYLRFTEITVSFTRPSFSVNENNGPAQPVLVLTQPVDCCSTISVWVNIEEDTAKGS